MTRPDRERNHSILVLTHALQDLGEAHSPQGWVPRAHTFFPGLRPALAGRGTRGPGDPGTRWGPSDPDSPAWPPAVPAPPASRTAPGRGPRCRRTGHRRRGQNLARPRRPPLCSGAAPRPGHVSSGACPEFSAERAPKRRLCRCAPYGSS